MNFFLPKFPNQTADPTQNEAQQIDRAGPNQRINIKQPS